MKKENRGGIVWVALGFVFGYIMKFVSEHYILPAVLPENMMSTIGLLSFLIGIGCSGIAVFAVIRIPYLLKERKQNKKRK